eukprot:TRINITY_DN24656_c0_g1_i1.p1 TRINITY_DN24656_c0_g1~~TRINITY_DN24656_c0_g1_i1.p1  ORF type:complete len:992 (-),score=151.24 TRINITY_DN24656_c0_g1_i1:158-3133(-)
MEDVTRRLAEDEDVEQVEVAAPAKRASRQRSPPPRAVSPPARSSRRRSPPPRAASPPRASVDEGKPNTRRLPPPQDDADDDHDDDLPSLIEATDISEPEVYAPAVRTSRQQSPPPRAASPPAGQKRTSRRLPSAQEDLSEPEVIAPALRTSRQQSPPPRSASPPTGQKRTSRRLPPAQDDLGEPEVIALVDSRQQSPPPRSVSPPAGQKRTSRRLPPAQEASDVAKAPKRMSRRLPPAHEDTDGLRAEVRNDETIQKLEVIVDEGLSKSMLIEDVCDAKIDMARDDADLNGLRPSLNEMRPSGYRLRIPQDDADNATENLPESTNVPARRSRACVFADDIRPSAANTALTAGAVQLPLVSKLAAEFVGTFLVVLTVGVSQSVKNEYAPIAIGLMLGIQVYNYAAVSGGMFNPAVTLAVLLSAREKISLVNAVFYMLIQFVAAITAAFVCLGITRDTLFFDYDASSSSLVHQGGGTSFLMELFFTCALCNTVLHTGTSRDTPNDYSGFAIGCTLVAGAIACGQNSQASFNPAVTVGMNVANYATTTSSDSEEDQIFYPSFGSWVVYLAAPFLGGALASLSFRIIRSNEYAAKESSVICEKPSLTQKALAECCGTFFLVLTVGTAGSSEGPLAPIGIGLMLAVQIYTFGAVSGGLFNPAVSFAVVLSGRKKLTPQGWLAYTSAQCCGALAAALVAIAMVNRSFFFKTYVSSTTPKMLRVGGFCSEVNSGFNGDWTLSGTTARGAPYWRKDLNCSEVGTSCTASNARIRTLLLYWDPDCNGLPGGEERWIFDEADANFTVASFEARPSDLDNDQECAYDARIDSPYSGVPPLGFNTWKERCPKYKDSQISLFEVPRDDSEIQRKWGTVLVLEVMFTCALASIVLVAGTSYDAPNEYFGFAIGGTVIAGAYSCNGFDQASFNPAVTFGINMAHGHGQTEGPSLDSWLLFILAPMIGGALAAGIFYATRLQEVQDFWARESETVGGVSPENALETE